MVALEVDEDSFKTGKRSVRHTNSFSDLDEGPRLMWETRANGCLNCRDFFIRYRNRYPAVSYNLQNSRSRDDRPAILKIESRKQVTREKRQFHFLHPIRPLTQAFVPREETLDPLFLQLRGNETFFAGMYMKRKPTNSSQRFLTLGIEDTHSLGSLSH